MDFQFLNELSQAVLQADRVLLLGHAQGESDVRKLISDHLEHHHPSASGRLEVKTVNDKGCTDAELIAIARSHFGNLPSRSTPGQPGRTSHNKQRD